MMMRLAFAIALLPAFVFAQASEVPQYRVQFDKGADHAVIEGTLTGHEVVDHMLGARAGQTMEADLQADGVAYFNVMAPGATWEAIFVGSRDGDAFAGELPADGDYALRVYLMGDDRDSGHTVEYVLKARITD